MSVTYTVTLSDAEAKAFAHIAVSPQEWVDNLVHSRCENAINEIVQKEVERKIAAGEPISGSKEDIVLAANIKTLAEIQAELEAAREAQLAARRAEAEAQKAATNEEPAA